MRSKRETSLHLLTWEMKKDGSAKPRGRTRVSDVVSELKLTDPYKFFLKRNNSPKNFCTPGERSRPSWRKQ